MTNVIELLCKRAGHRDVFVVKDLGGGKKELMMPNKYGVYVKCERCGRMAIHYFTNGKLVEVKK